jgi:hypothetical protein
VEIHQRLDKDRSKYNQIKMVGLPLQKQMALLFHSHYVPAQTGHHQVIREQYTNDEGIYLKTTMLA